MSDKFFYDSNLHKITYAAVRRAMKKEKAIPYKMSLVGHDAEAVIRAVNERIDAHLEACYCPSLGDVYEHGERKIGDKVVSHTLECLVSEESLPVLLRRLSEQDYAEDDEASNLLGSILSTLGFDDYGKYVGCKALGLD